MFIVGEKLWASLFSRDSNEHIMLNILTNLQSFTLCFFDCKYKSLKRLGENMKQTERNINKQKNSIENRQNRNTGYPALDPTANKYLSGSGWEISVCFVFSVFLVVLFVLLLYVFVRL